MPRFASTLALGLSAAMVLAGCSANHKSIYRHKNLEDDKTSAILVDAKQRAILQQLYEKYSIIENTETKAKETRVESVRRFCSEPSPDVFSVIAQSLSAGGTFGQAADPKSIEAALNFASSSSETGATIPKTQTINMLRELMFRTCERYLSGGYDEMELSIQAVRDQRLMVSILAIEQLTGAVTPNPVVIKTGGSSSAGLGEEAVKTFDKLRDQKKAAEAAEKAAQEAYDKDWKAEEEGGKSVCEATEQDEEEKERCKDLKVNLDAAKATKAEATKAYNVVEQAMTTGGVSATTVSEAVANGGLTRASTESTTKVAATVERIVEMNFNDNTETMLFCLRSIRRSEELRVDENQKKMLISKCLEYLEKDIELEIKKTENKIEYFEDINDINFNLFWNGASLPDGISPDGVKIGRIFLSVFPKQDELSDDTRDAIKAMNSSKNRVQARAAFMSFTQQARKALAEAAK